MIDKMQTTIDVKSYHYYGHPSVSYGKMETLTPVKSKSFYRLTHNLSGLIMSTRGMFVPNLVKKSVHGRLLGKGVNYNFLCDFFIIFLGPT